MPSQQCQSTEGSTELSTNRIKYPEYVLDDFRNLTELTVGHGWNESTNLDGSRWSWVSTAPPSLKQTSSEQWWLSGGQEGKLSGLFCAVLCATIVHSELHTHMNRTNSSLVWVLSHWGVTGPISLCLDSFLCMYDFVSDCILHACVVVTWWDAPGGIEAWSLGPLLPSVLWHCWLGHLTRKTRPRDDL